MKFTWHLVHSNFKTFFEICKLFFCDIWSSNLMKIYSSNFSFTCNIYFEIVNIITPLPFKSGNIVDKYFEIYYLKLIFLIFCQNDITTSDIRFYFGETNLRQAPAFFPPIWGGGNYFYGHTHLINTDFIFKMGKKKRNFLFPSLVEEPILEGIEKLP